MKCPSCDHEQGPDLSATCMNCGYDMSANLSVDTDKVDDEDALVEAASIPDLGAMLRRGKKKGYITPQEEGSGKAV